MTAGQYHTCAIRSDDKIVCWGANNDGQLGIGSSSSVGLSTSDMGNNLVPADLGAGTHIS